MRDGRLEAIFRRWKMWNDDQPRLYARADGRSNPGRAPQTHRATSGRRVVARGRRRCATCRRCCAPPSSPWCCRAVDGAGVVVGVLIASGRVYGPAPLQALLTGWVELIRGTPLLLQLFVLYFGLATVVQLPAFLAALLGLGLNYARLRERDLSRRAQAVPPGQLDAARTLGFSERQTLMLVRGPQAVRLALAPMTNDFVALLKDSSLVSVITVVELTKQTSIFAANIGSWVVPGCDVRGACIWCCRCRWRSSRDGSSGRWRPVTPVSVLDGPRSRRCDVARGRSCAASRSPPRAARSLALMGASGRQDDACCARWPASTDCRRERRHRWPAAGRRTVAARRDASRAAPRASAWSFSSITCSRT